MVYHGPSRGCETCKKRHKKCDEARPFCKKCATSGRLCLGYKSDWDITIRYYGAPSQLPAKPSISAPKNELFEDPSDAELEKNALAIFYEDYCIKTKDPAISRGFLHGISYLISCAGSESNIAKAARLVALGGVANRLQRPNLARKTEEAYGAVLYSYLNHLSSDPSSHGVESLITAVLLGLYEIIMSCEDSPDQHMAHVNGIGAMVNLPQSPFNLLGAIQLLQLGNPLMLREPSLQSPVDGLSYSPIVHHSIQSLDSLTKKINPLYHQATTLFSEPGAETSHVQDLEKDASVLELEFAAWPKAQTGDWLPKSIGYMTEELAAASLDGHFWPGPVDVYYDLYICSVWNTYRKTHMILLQILAKCKRFLTNSEHFSPRETGEVDRLAKEIAASIPFHLVKDLVLQDETNVESLESAKPVGGLLLLHPLYLAAAMPIVSPQIRQYMKGRLAWIGKNLGIRQASLLCQPNAKIPYKRMAEGHVLIWAGMLLYSD